MFRWAGKVASKLWRPLRRYVRLNRDEIESSQGTNDELLWSMDLERHAFGEFSYAVVQANETLEDLSQVEIGQNATFVGVYDGHGGPQAARYVCDHLFCNFVNAAQDRAWITIETITSAIMSTEQGFLNQVRETYREEPRMASVGSCCLIGIIWQSKLFYGNLGDSRAVLGWLRTIPNTNVNVIVAQQLTFDHNANVGEVRHELRTEHPDDPDIVVERDGCWRVKGVIQVSRTIGDAWLKRPAFATAEDFPRFNLQRPIRRPVLKCSPTVMMHNLTQKDKFVVLASDGLWENISNQEVIEMVYNNERRGIACKLVKAAMKVAAKKRKKSYKQVKKLGRGYRRSCHDDITVVVVFIDHELLEQNAGVHEEVSVQAPSNFNQPSQMARLQGFQH